MNTLKASWSSFDLKFIHPFTVAQFSRTTTPIVILKLELNGVIGYGEACMPPYLGESIESVFSFFDKVNFDLFRSDELESFLTQIDQIAEHNNAAKAAIDIALHDALSKINNNCLTDYLNIPKVNKLSSYTIGIDTIDKMVEKTIEAKNAGFQVLKIKIGTDNDIELLEAILNHWDKPFSVDVNQGWKSLEYAIEVANYLKTKKALFIEQPFHKDEVDLHLQLKNANILPIIADESIKRLKDLENLYSNFDGVNIKLMKSTGIREAQKMIAFAQLKGLKVVTGCMAESSCAATAASNLIAYADWVDIDAPYLISNDPFKGMKIENGVIIPSKTHGIGVDFLVH